MSYLSCVILNYIAISRRHLLFGVAGQLQYQMQPIYTTLSSDAALLLLPYSGL